MAGFLYFLSGHRGMLTRERVCDAGLSYILDTEDSVSCREAMGNTPSGAPGVTFAVAERHMRDIKLDAAQTWRKMPRTVGDGNLWVGYWNDDKPTPEALARAKQLPGDSLLLGDGNRWRVPKVLALEPEAQRYRTALPTQWDYNDMGEWVRGSIVEEYRALWDAAAPFADERFAIETGEPSRLELDQQALLSCVVTLLQSNYVVGQAELVMMGALCDDASTGLVPFVACDFMALMDWERALKKSEFPSTPSGADTNDGSAG